MERESKIIRDIDSVEQFRKILVVGYTLPITAGVILYAISFISSAAHVSSPAFHLIIFLIFSPPVLFTPYFIYILFKEKRYGWLVTYILFVVLPGITTVLIIHGGIFEALWMPLLMLPFYLFCFFIKFSVEEWITEYRAEQDLIRQRKEWEEKKKEGLL